MREILIIKKAKEKKERRFQSVWYETDFQRLRKFAFDNDVSINHVITRAVEMFLEERGY